MARDRPQLNHCQVGGAVCGQNTMSTALCLWKVNLQHFLFTVIYAPNKSSLKLLLKEITSPLKWVFNHAQLFVQTLQPHRTFARGPWCFPNSLLSQLALECDSMLFPFQLKGSWGYKGIWLIGQNPVKFAEKQVTAKGEGCGGGECVNRGAQDQPKSLLKSPSPAHTVVRG